MAHSRYSPSSLPHLAECPGFQGGLPSIAATRGTDLNALIDQVLAGEFVDIPTEFEDHVNMAIREIRSAQSWVGEPNQVMTQVFLKGQIPETDGTVDVVILNEFDSRAVVLDFKSGWTERPPANANLQLAAYGSAAVAKWNLDLVQLRIVELDKKRVSSATLTGHNLCAQTLPKIFALIKRAQSATEKDWSANSSCKYCIRHITCPAVQRDTLIPASALATSITDDPTTWANNLTAADCGRFLDTWKNRVELASSIMKHVEQRAFTIIKSGTTVDGWEIGEGRKTRSWIDPIVANVELQKKLGPGVLETSLMSPAQIEKQFGKKAVKSILDDLVKSVPSEKLVAKEGAK